MRDDELVRFLQWALPRLGLRWPGFRKVRRQVGRRLRRRLVELGLPDLAAYRRHLELERGEWRRLEPLCRITISRFLRDRGLFHTLAREVVPRLVRGRPGLRVLCAGCASGEEPYSLVLLWELGRPAPGLALEVVATDVDPHMLERARRAVYARATLRELPASWIEQAFAPAGELLELSPRFRRPVTFVEQDLRRAAPPGTFQLVLCRNLAFTYFGTAAQLQTARRIAGVLEPGGALLLGSHERLPRGTSGFERFFPERDLPLYRRVPA